MKLKNLVIGVQITPEIRQNLDDCAKLEDRTISWIVRKSIDTYVEIIKRKNEKPKE